MSGAPAPVGAAATLASRLATAELNEPLPWQVVQVRVETSTDPFTCLPPATRTLPEASTVPEWQRTQVVTAAALWWFAVAGGALWHEPQSAAAPFQDQVATLPRVVAAFRVAPWQ